MKGFEAFKIYQAMRLHFTQDNYNAIKYNFKVNVKQSAFQARRDRVIFEFCENKRPNREKLISYFLSNFITGKLYIRDFNEEAHASRIARLESLTYNFQKEMKIVAESGISFDKACSSFEQDSFIGHLMRNEVSLETIILVDLLVDFVKDLRKLPDPIGVYTEWLLRLEKYRLFFKMPEKKREKIIESIKDSFK
jgi:hypothetical protein